MFQSLIPRWFTVSSLHIMSLPLSGHSTSAPEQLPYHTKRWEPREWVKTYIPPYGPTPRSSLLRIYWGSTSGHMFHMYGLTYYSVRKIRHYYPKFASNILLTRPHCFLCRKKTCYLLKALFVKWKLFYGKIISLISDFRSSVSTLHLLLGSTGAVLEYNLLGPA